MLTLLFIAFLIVTALLAIGRIFPWENIGRFLKEGGDERPAWVEADGQVYRIALFPELFTVIGSQYGGDGKTTFAVPKIEEFTSAPMDVTSSPLAP